MVREALPGGPVVLREGVFEKDDGVAGQEGVVEVGEGVAGEIHAGVAHVGRNFEVEFVVVIFWVEKFGGCGIDSYLDLAFVVAVANGGGEEVEGFVWVGNGRGESAFVADAGCCDESTEFRYEFCLGLPDGPNFLVITDFSS